MKMKRFVLEAGLRISLAMLASLFLVREAHAYLDPGTGSYVLQILIAGLFGALFMLKVFWGRIVGFFGRSSPKSEAPVQDPSQDKSNQFPTRENVQPPVQNAQSESSDE